MSGRRNRAEQVQHLGSTPEPQRWGWHRLCDQAADQVVRAAEVRPGDLVVDVGAGEGALTRPLVAAGARVIAVELHPGRLETLRRRFEGDPVTVVSADALQLRWPRQPFRVVANPPYAVWAALLRQLLGRQSRLTAADLVLPRRVVRQTVDRHAAGSTPGRGVFVLERGISVPRTSFRPLPRVDSAVLLVRRTVVRPAGPPRRRQQRLS